MQFDEKRSDAEDGLRLREPDLQNVLDSALDAVVSMNAAGIITFWSRRAEAVFGWTRQEAIGRCLGDLIIPERMRDSHRRGLARYSGTELGPILGQRLQMIALRGAGPVWPV